MAIVHTAVFDAMNAVVGGYQSYTGLHPAPLGTSVEAAIAVAAHDTLAALFSSQEDDLDQVLAEDLRIIPEGRAKTLGITLGQAAADAILARREDDGSDHPEPKIGIDWISGNGPGQWRQDPISKHPLAPGRALERGRAVRCWSRASSSACRRRRRWTAGCTRRPTTR